MKTRLKIFQSKTKSVFLPKIRWRPKKKKRSILKFCPVFGQTKVFAYCFWAQTCCSSKKGGACHNFAYFSMLIILPWRPKREGHGPMAPPKYALGLGILQTAKNRSFQCIMMQNGNHLLVGDMALSRWESFIATTKFKQRKRWEFMYIIVVKPAVI